MANPVRAVGELFPAPIKTPMYPDEVALKKGELARPWVMWFQQMFGASKEMQLGPSGPTGPSTAGIDFYMKPTFSKAFKYADAVFASAGGVTVTVSSSAFKVDYVIADGLLTLLYSFDFSLSSAASFLTLVLPETLMATLPDQSSSSFVVPAWTKVGAGAAEWGTVTVGGSAPTKITWRRLDLSNYTGSTTVSLAGAVAIPLEPSFTAFWLFAAD